MQPMTADARPKTLALFGGSGATGRQVIRRAVDRGLRVRALVRNAGTMEAASDLVDVLVGSLLKPEDVGRTIDGTEAVCCVFGPRPPYIDIFCADATRVVVDAMRRCSVDCILCQTGAMIGEYPRNRSLPFRLMIGLFNRWSPAAARDRAEQERLVLESGLRWTIVKPPKLTNAAATGKYEVGRGVRVGLMSSISRADIAEFIVREILAPRHVGEAVFIRGG
jgi:putative NADH-flavin reductase